MLVNELAERVFVPGETLAERIEELHRWMYEVLSMWIDGEGGLSMQ